MRDKLTSVLAIIPARGASKGIPRKNILPLCGKPLIAWTIEAAMAADSVDRVVVSTDDVRIASVSRAYGADVIERPAEISTDDSPSEAALLHALDFLRETEGYEPDLLVFLQCTAPLTAPADIDGTIQALVDQDTQSALAVTPFHHFLWKREESGDSVGINHDKRVRKLRQQLPQTYLETGSVYAMRATGFREIRHRFFAKTALYVMPKHRCWEIDDPGDLAIAEALLQDRLGQERVRLLPQNIEALILDFDGVFTDNRVYVFEDGREAVACDRSDGLGLSRLRNMGLPMLVLSTEANPVVRARCQKLELNFMQGVADKLSVMKKWLEEQGLSASDTVYVGNDVNDSSCMKAVGCGVAVGDAHPEVKKLARIVLSAPGGRGAIREVAEAIELSMTLWRRGHETEDR